MEREEGGWTDRTVNSGDTTAPYCADFTDGGKSPLVVGDRQRIHIPHQQSILKNPIHDSVRILCNVVREDHSLSKIRRVAGPCP